MKAISEEKILEKVRGVIEATINVKTKEIKPESSLVDDLGADSLDAIEVIMALEEEFKEFDIQISDADAAKLRTVQDIIDYIKEQTKKEQTE